MVLPFWIAVTRRVLKLPSPDDLPQLLKAECNPGDIFVCLGAGDITTWANALEAKLASQQP